MFSFNKNNKNISGEKDLKEALNLRSETISIIAHQLRTRLSATKWVLAMFVGGDYGKLPQEQEVMLKKALEALEDSIKLSSELISINHAEDVTLNYDLKPIDIVKTLDDVIFDFSGESHKKNISIENNYNILISVTLFIKEYEQKFLEFKSFILSDFNRFLSGSILIE